jgi:prepilin-type N-terminal cleavage/methylation domain-containing protein
MKTKNMNSKKGFTLLEILLVIAAIAILAGIVIVAINPAKQLAETRNAQRRVNVETILSAVYQYAIDNNGTIPATIPGVATEICRDATASCLGLVDLSVLTTTEKYITAIPVDPKADWATGSCSGTTTDAVANRGACYEILKTANNRITVSAPDTETAWGAQIISVTR